jgi:hypothetical protein
VKKLKSEKYDPRPHCLRTLRAAKKLRAQINKVDHKTSYYDAKALYDSYESICNHLGLWAPEILKMVEQAERKERG